MEKNIKNVEIQAINPKSFYDFIEKHPEVIVDVIISEINKGNHKLITSINTSKYFI